MPFMPRVSLTARKPAVGKATPKAITNTRAKRLSLPLVNQLRNPAPMTIPSFFPAKPAPPAVPAHLVKSLLREIPHASAAIRARVSSDPIAVAVAIAAAATAVAVIVDLTAVDEVIVVDAIAVDVPEVA